jgi:hypothetical protein
MGLPTDLMVQSTRLNAHVQTVPGDYADPSKLPCLKILHHSVHLPLSWFLVYRKVLVRDKTRTMFLIAALPSGLLPPTSPVPSPWPDQVQVAFMHRVLLVDS